MYDTVSYLYRQIKRGTVLRILILFVVFLQLFAHSLLLLRNPYANKHLSPVSIYRYALFKGTG